MNPNTDDMVQRADIIVMEIFDSALLGEGVIETMNDALARLCQPDVIVIPDRATVFGQLVSVPRLFQTFDLRSTAGSDLSLETGSCMGTGSPHEVHASKLLEDMTQLSAPFALKEFDFRSARVWDVQRWRII
jgi:hypothetical protein